MWNFTVRVRSVRRALPVACLLSMCIASVSGGQVLFEDAFDQAADDATLAEPWRVLEGDPSVDNGRLFVLSRQANPYIVTDQSFEGDLSVSARWMYAPWCHWSGLVVKDMYWLTFSNWTADGNRIVLRRRAGRVPNGVAPEVEAKELLSVPWPTVWNDMDVVLRLDCEGNTLRAYVDDQLLGEVTDEAMPSSGRIAVVGGFGSGFFVDDLTVRRYRADLKPAPVVPFAMPKPPEPTLAKFTARLDRQDAIYHDNEAATLTMNWQAESTGTITCRIKLIDFNDRIVAETETAVEQTAGQMVEISMALRAPRRGIFKPNLTVTMPDGTNVPQGDIISFIVVPERIGQRPADPDSPFGGHPHWEVPEHHYALARKIGLRWARDHDAIQYTWWPKVQPERDTWNWYDDEMDLLQRNHLTLLGEFLYVPKWAADLEKDPDPEPWGFVSPPADIEDFRRYVFETVKHYRDHITHWEVWNEPHWRGFWRGTPEQYVEHLKVAYEAAKQANPDCTIIGGGGFGPQPGSASFGWAEKAIRAGMGRYCDIVSVHYFNGGVPRNGPRQPQIDSLQRLRRMMRQHGGEKPVWDTEASVSSTSFLDRYRYKAAEPYALHHFREAAYGLVRMYIVEIANGIEKIFYYHILWPRRDGWIPEFHENPVMTNMMELHGGVKPFGVAYATMADILDRARFIERIALTDDANAYLFDNGTERIAVYWGNFPGPQWTEQKLRIRPVGSWQASDVMNVRTPLADAPVVELPLTRAPIFIIARNCTRDAFTTAWRNAEVVR